MRPTYPSLAVKHRVAVSGLRLVVATVPMELCYLLAVDDVHLSSQFHEMMDRNRKTNVITKSAAVFRSATSNPTKLIKKTSA